MPPQQSLISNFLIKLTPEEKKERDAEAFAKIRDGSGKLKAKTKLELQSRAEKEHGQALKRQQRRRERIKNEEIAAGLRDPRTGAVIKEAKLTDKSVKPQPRPNNKNQSIDGQNKPNRKDPKPRLRAKRKNWFSPELWPGIEEAQRFVGVWRAHAIVTHLQASTTGRALYRSLNRGTVQKWFEEINGETQWSAKTRKKVEEERKRVAEKTLGRPRILAKYKTITDSASMQVKILRETGIPISRTLVRGILLGLIQSLAPQLLQNPRFKCSEAFVRRFLSTEMQYSSWAGTRAAQKTPEDWEEKCEDAFLRAVYHIKLHDIPASLIINADQTGVSLLPMGNKTYAPRGSKQIAILGKEEKRQFTAMVATSASGKMLPMQCVWSGKTHLSLPWKNIRSDSESRGNRWVPGGDSHWSSLETMKQWVSDILVPYIERVKQEDGLPEDSMVLLIIDCWSVHRSEAFLNWMKKEHRRIRIIFVPGGCTGKFQPADVGIQRIFKHLIKSAALEWIAAETKKQIDAGTRPAAVEIPTEIAPLRNASVAWIDSAREYFVSNPDIVRRSWLKCETKNWNLSYEALTSQRARAVVLERIDEDPAFALSVATEREGRLEDANQEIEPEYDDDTALSTADLVAVHFDGETGDVEEDENGGGGVLMKLGPEEEELTDRDAEGNTDPELTTNHTSSEAGPQSPGLENESEEEPGQGNNDGDGAGSGLGGEWEDWDGVSCDWEADWEDDYAGFKNGSDSCNDGPPEHNAMASMHVGRLPCSSPGTAKRSAEEIEISSSEDLAERAKRARYIAPPEISVPSSISGSLFVLSDSE